MSELTNEGRATVDIGRIDGEQLLELVDDEAELAITIVEPIQDTSQRVIGGDVDTVGVPGVHGVHDGVQVAVRASRGAHRPADTGRWQHPEPLGTELRAQSRFDERGLAGARG